MLPMHPDLRCKRKILTKMCSCCREPSEPLRASDEFVASVLSVILAFSAARSSTTVSATPAALGSVSSGVGQHSLQPGADTQVEVVGCSQAGTCQTYTVVVSRLPNPDAKLTALALSSSKLPSALSSTV